MLTPKITITAETCGDSPLNVFPEFSPTQVIIQTEAPGYSSSLVETLISKRHTREASFLA